MKKGFTMIELIFVIVILGILASVAIPRLAATREDAEISTAVANLRTLISEASGYYVAQGTFSPGGTAATWNAITNVPLLNGTGGDASTTNATTEAYLKAGGKPCIGVKLVGPADGAPAHIVFSENSTNSSSGVCQQVLASKPIQDYKASKFTYTSTKESEKGQSKQISSAIAIGSTSRVTY